MLVFAGMTNELTTPKLWNKNFSILVVGSFISMMGYICASFAMGLFVYDQTDSIGLYALTLACSTLPRIIAPALAGTFLDRRSRRKVIYSLDFIYAGLFGTVAILLNFGVFKYYAMYIVVSAILGFIDGVYFVAFDSLFPLLVTTENTRKAYSINSLLYPVASIIMTPLTLLVFDQLGPFVIFCFSTVLFAITATVETQIIIREPHLIPYEREKQMKLPASPKEIEMTIAGQDLTAITPKKERASFFADFVEGTKYIGSEKGLLAITIYFFIISICGSAQGALLLPYFRGIPTFNLFGADISGTWVYLIVFGCSTIGRVIGGNVQYRVKFKQEKKYIVAVFVYIATNVISMVLLHLPVWTMMLCMLVEGMLSVTSYNIRISSTQVYVPDQKRGRFNGAFMFFNNLGSLLGQLLVVAIGSAELSVPWLITCIFGFNLISVFIIVLPAGKHIKPIYNSDL